MEAPELLIAFRGTNFSRRTSSDPSRGDLEPYFAKSHPSVSPFSAKKNMVRTRIGSIFGIWQLGVGSLSLALGGLCSTFLSEEMRSQTHLGHFWTSFGLFWVLHYCWIFAPFSLYNSRSTAPILGSRYVTLICQVPDPCKLCAALIDAGKKQ